MRPPLRECSEEKKQAAQGEANRAAWLAKSSGEEGKLEVAASQPRRNLVPTYIDDGLLVPAAGVDAG